MRESARAGRRAKAMLTNVEDYEDLTGHAANAEKWVSQPESARNRRRRGKEMGNEKQNEFGKLMETRKTGIGAKRRKTIRM